MNFQWKYYFCNKSRKVRVILTFVKIHFPLLPISSLTLRGKFFLSSLSVVDKWIISPFYCTTFLPPNHYLFLAFFHSSQFPITFSSYELRLGWLILWDELTEQKIRTTGKLTIKKNTRRFILQLCYFTFEFFWCLK